MRKGKEWEPFWSDAHGWQVDFSVYGERIRRRLGLRDRSLKDIARRKAEALYREAWDRHLNPTPERTGTPFHQAARGYVEAGGEARYLAPLLRHFGKEAVVEDMTEAVISDAAREIYPQATAATIRRQLRTPIKAVVNWSAGRRPQPSSDVARVRWLTPEEAERLMEEAAKLTLPRHQSPERFTLQKVAFMLGTGVRASECFAAEVQGWNRATRQWWIAGELPGAAKTSGAARWVRLPHRAVDLIGELPVGGRAFRTAYGREIVVASGRGGQMQTSFNAARDAAGLGPDVTPHVLRHTWATWFYAQTRDFGALMDLGGWSSADMANRYRKLAPDDLADRLLDHGWDFRLTFGNILETPENIVQIQGAFRS